MAIFSAAGIGSENFPFTYRGKTGFRQGVILKYLQITILPMKPGLPEAEAEVKAPSLGKELACPFVNPLQRIFCKKIGASPQKRKDPVTPYKAKRKTPYIQIENRRSL